MNKKNIFLILAVIFIILFSGVVIADFKTLWNPWTNRLDFILGDNLDGNINITGNLTVHGGLLVQVSPPTTEMANLTLLDAINGTYAFSNLTLLSIDNGTSYALNATPVIGSPFFVYGANSSVALTLLTNSTDYSINLALGNLTVLNDNLSGYNLTVDYSARTIYDFNATNIIDVRVYAANKTTGSLTPLTLLSAGNYTVTEGGTFELTEFAWNGSNITLDYTRIDYSPILPGSASIEKNLSANWYDGGLNWTNLDLYPVACPTGYFVTRIADEITCTAANQTFGDFNLTGNLTVDSYIKTEANRNLTLLPDGNGIVIIGDASLPSHTLNENDDLFVSDNLEVDDTAWFDGTAIFSSQSIHNSNARARFGTTSESFISWSTTQTQPALVLGAGEADKHIIIMDQGDINTNFAHSSQNNPTLFIQSSDETQIDEWLSLSYHNQSGQAVLEVGDGTWNFSTKGHTNLLLANDSYNRFGNRTTTEGLDSPNDLLISGDLEVDGLSSFANSIRARLAIILDDEKFLQFGSSGDAVMAWSITQTPNAVLFGVGADSNNFIITDRDDISTNFAHPLQTNPTLFFQSSDGTQVNQWLSLAYSNESAAAIISTGVGAINLTTPGHTNLWLANDSYNRFGNGTTSQGLDNPNDLMIGGELETSGKIFGGNNIFAGTGFRFGVNGVGVGYYPQQGNQNPSSTAFTVHPSSRAIIISEDIDRTINFAHPLQTNPTIFIQSSDATQINQWLSLAYDNTTSQSVIANGAGDMNISAVGNITFGSGGGDLLLPDYMNVSWGGGAKMWTNSSCVFLASPAGTGLLEVCD